MLFQNECKLLHIALGEVSNSLLYTTAGIDQLLNTYYFSFLHHSEEFQSKGQSTYIIFGQHSNI